MERLWRSTAIEHVAQMRGDGLGGRRRRGARRRILDSQPRRHVAAVADDDLGAVELRFAACQQHPVVKMGEIGGIVTTSGSSPWAWKANQCPVRAALPGHLVEHEQRVALRAERAHRAQVVRTRHHDAALALQRLQQDGGDGVGVERFVQPVATSS